MTELPHQSEILLRDTMTMKLGCQTLSAHRTNRKLLKSLTLALMFLAASWSAFAQVSQGFYPAGDTVRFAGCMGQNVGSTTVTPFNLTATGKLITGVAGKKIYICALDITTATTQNIALVEGTTVSTACDTNPVGMAGGNAAATGWNLAANGGLTKGDGRGIVYVTALAGNNVCMLLSSTGQTSGSITWVQF